MNDSLERKLGQELDKIDRPGSFCVSGSAPFVLPGLEVKGIGPIALPLTSGQAKELIKHCEQAPYGKGEQTLVDTQVRRVWHLTPDRFTLTNPDWDTFLKETLTRVKTELGLEKQKLESHLFDLLLYEPGGFFLPHRDGEKLDRMVATLVVVLPSAHQGGELVIRHEGQEKTIDFSSKDNNQFRIQFAAFYADCEHEIRPLSKGHRLCLIYNLTLAKAKKGLKAPRTSEHITAISKILREWAADEAARKIIITLDHQYTKDGLTWDRLKGVDRVKARVLADAAGQADCQAYLALLTLHQSGSAEGGDGGGYYGWRRRWDDYDDEDEDEDGSDYEMGEIYDSSLTAEHFSDRDGKTLPLGEVDIDEGELLDPDALEDVDPETEFEGYTGNAGMTLDHWYRHAAIFIWPASRSFDIFCDAGIRYAVRMLGQLVSKWKRASKSTASELKASCIRFAASILERWKPNSFIKGWDEKEQKDTMLRSLAALGDADLISTYLGEVLPKDTSADPGKALAEVCQKYGWHTFRPQLEGVVRSTTRETIERNIRLLEHVCLARPGKKEGWRELCESLGRIIVGALEESDQSVRSHDYYLAEANRVRMLTALTRALISTSQKELLERVVEHVLARPKIYPLKTTQIPALADLRAWIAKNVKEPCPPLSRWVAACRAQLEELTAREPEEPADFRRDATVTCKCADCRELNQFLANPSEEVHHFRMAEDRRRHLEYAIRENHCDLSFKTEKGRSPYTLVCTKTTASYKARLKEYHQDQERLATVLKVQASLPG